jgi:hypothetical protein
LTANVAILESRSLHLFDEYVSESVSVVFRLHLDAASMLTPWQVLWPINNTTLNHVMPTLFNSQQLYDQGKLLSQADARKQMSRCPQVLYTIVSSSRRIKVVA